MAIGADKRDTFLYPRSTRFFVFVITHYAKGLTEVFLMQSYQLAAVSVSVITLDEKSFDSIEGLDLHFRNGKRAKRNNKISYRKGMNLYKGQAITDREYNKC
jgi:hypothetical protein